MRRSLARRSIVVWSCLTFLAGAIAAHAQVAARNAGPEAGGADPRLPDATTRPPDWVGKDAPFDVARFLAAPPRDKNAAPLYIDALFEFSPAMEVCFPAGPERDRRRKAAADRGKRYLDAMRAVSGDPKAIPPPTEADAIIRSYEAGFRKLAEARRRERCVFETTLAPGLEFDRFSAMVPLADAGRQVARIADLRVARAVERGRFDDAIDDVEAVLRLAGDLRPRGGFMTQLVSAAMVQLVGASLVTPILASPKLRVAQCDRLMKVLAAHGVKGNAAYAEAVRAGYLEAGTTLRDLVRDQAGLAARLGAKPGEPLIKAALGLGRGNLELPRDAAARLARTSPAELDRARRDLDRHFAALLKLEGLTASDRCKRLAAMKPGGIGGKEPLSLVVMVLEYGNSNPTLAESTARAEATLAAAECWVALRRWRLSHRGWPRALAVAVKEAGLGAVPTDPYDGRPMKLALVGGETVIYSVGKDGKDDEGLVDSVYDSRPTGDLIYRQPAVEGRRGAR